MDSHIPLADAAKELGLTWEATWRHVLTHRLDGERRSRNWYVSRASVQKLEKELKGEAGR
jgi:hypothetical protein